MAWTPLFKRHNSAKIGVVSPLKMKCASTMKITTIGIDLAKNVFQIHGVDDHRKVGLRKILDRAKVLEFCLKRQPCLIGMEACGSAHLGMEVGCNGTGMWILLVVWNHGIRAN